MAHSNRVRAGMIGNLSRCGHMARIPGHMTECRKSEEYTAVVLYVELFSLKA